MDFVNLEKMKVVDLRNELQTRGLDTKGVKAVLIERLRAHLEGGSGVVPPSPGTPGRRSRRTRSMTKSPSPSPVKKDLEPVLETLEEESNANVEEEQNKKVPVAEKLNESPSQETTPLVEKAEIENNFQREENNESANETEAKEEEVQKEIITDDQQTNGKEIAANACEYGDAPENISYNTEEVANTEPQEPNKSIRDETGENNHQDVELSESISEEKQDVSPKKSNKALRERSRSRSTDRRERCNRSRSKSHSRTRSRSPRNKTRSRSHSRSRTHSRSPKRRSGVGSFGSPTKEGEDISTPEDEPTIEENQFGLSWFDSDIYLRIDPVTFLSAKPMSHDVYTLVWCGARTNYGVREGKVCFEVRLSEETHLNRDNPFRDEPCIKGFRVGFSTPSSNLLLGESENSFAYCESGRKATNGDFVDYAKSFQLDDVIGCYLNLDDTPCTIKYTLNGEDLGVAFEFDKAIIGEDQALFPHVLTKGYEYEINLADNENLLVNKERKTRKKRKVKKIEENISKEENPDEEIKINEEKAIQDGIEEKLDGSKDEEQLQQQIESQEQKVEDAKPDLIKEKTEECPEAEKNETCETSKEENEENGKNNEEADPTAAVEDKTKDEKNSSEPKAEDDNHIDKDNDEKSSNKDNDDDGPSPVKRQKMEQNEEEEEDEYEEIHPAPRDHMPLLGDYELIALIAEDKYIPGPQRPESRKDCEVILMVGLPGAGKTTWVLNHIKENPEKRYHVIGADALIAKMTVDGAPRKTVHKGRFDRIYELCFNVLSSLEDIAIKRRRNFILDQANAYASSQRRKMKGFADFKRTAVVCIPNEEELKRRLADKKEKGNAYTLKETTLNTLKGAFTLPSLEFGWFDDIIFNDLGVDEAKEEVKRYNESGKKALDESHSNRDKRQRRDSYRNDNRRRQDDRRRYDNRNDSRWNDRRGGGGGSGGYHHGGGGSGGGGGGGNRWVSGGGYRNNFGGYKDDRGYGGGGGGRGYDNRNQRFNSGPQNWVQNRNRYDDRNNRYSSGGGGGSGRYDSYGSGPRDYRSGGGGNRDNRDRNRDGNGGGGGSNRRDSYRSGGSSNQRDFRRGHRDTREDSRGGSSATSATASTSSNHKSSSVAAGNNGGYDKYNKNKPQANNWAQYQQHQAGAVGQHQQQYWNYNTQGYGGQQQWETMNAQQQQQWMTYWQQQNGAQQAADGGAIDPSQYWSQYTYSTSAAAPKK